jgi:hypothetical protein
MGNQKDIKLSIILRFFSNTLEDVFHVNVNSEANFKEFRFYNVYRNSTLGIELFRAM